MMKCLESRHRSTLHDPRLLTATLDIGYWKFLVGYSDLLTTLLHSL